AGQREFDMVKDLRGPLVCSDREAEVADLKQWRLHRERRSRGSKMSRNPSPKRLKPSTVKKIASPGNVENHQASGKYCRVSAIARPQSGSGGVAPMPRNPRTAATRIVNPMPIVARTMIGEMQFGRMCKNNMRGPLAPTHCRASTNNEAFNRRVSA